MFRLVVLSGFLGAGKTTMMVGAARALGRRGRRVAVITNDQAGDLVDTAVATHGLPEGAVAEITGGCFCCRFEDLERTIREVVDRTGADTVIAEAVGSCTDLQATVLRPLRRFYGDSIRVAPLTTLVEPVRMAALGFPTPTPGSPRPPGPPFANDPEHRTTGQGAVDDPDRRPVGQGIEGSPERRWGAEGDLEYLFERQLAEADVIALTKLDAQRGPGLVGELARRYPYALVVPCSAVTGLGMEGVLEAWEAPEPAGRDLEVDYDRYAAAEARLGWLNARYLVDGAVPGEWVLAVLEELSRVCARAGYLVGHAKITASDVGGLAKASLVAAGAAPVLDIAGPEAAGVSRAVVNVRVGCSPYELEGLVANAIRAADEATGARSMAESTNAFSPSYPRPVHRFPAA
ncbi:GTP-binding protein [Nonomuraea sediminis]|uniref:GTP-binding protein n=1 Tax=Nonomuraea sediminis TaxID=2835864 RepID=UPI001BDDB877|nr:GTP-binding protein [Nonomuraea sediminis]